MLKGNYCGHWKSKLNYRSITFVDEKPFELRSVPNKQNTRTYRHKSQKHTISPIQVEKHSQKIHTFCCINWYGKSNIRVYIENVPKKKGNGFRRKYLQMDTETTIDSFSEYLVPFLHKTGMENNRVLMDGARCHISKKTQNWLVENKMNIIPYGGKPLETTNGYPPNSPDLNPIENVFGYWDSQVKKHDPQNIDD